MHIVQQVLKVTESRSFAPRHTEQISGFTKNNMNIKFLLMAFSEKTAYNQLRGLAVA
jgi:hypothetical protein